MNQLWGCVFGKKGFAQVARIHISLDEPIFKGLQKELINSLRMLVIIY